MINRRMLGARSITVTLGDLGLSIFCIVNDDDDDELLLEDDCCTAIN